MTDSLLRQAAMSALWALDINDRWHYANDEHGGYPESELCDQTQAAIATLRTALAQQAAQPVELAALVAERDLAIHEQDTAQESLRRHQMWLQEAQAERDALRQDVQRLSEALRQEIDPPTFMGEPVSLLRKPVKSIADIKECYCPQDKCQAPVIMGRQTPCIRKMKEQK